MRLNLFIAQATGLSRRAADSAIAQGRISINGKAASLGQQITDNDAVTLDNQPIVAPIKFSTLILNKPVNYVCSKDGQGSKTVYELLPPEFQHLKSVGRLDKDSSGLLILTSDGKLANELTHPRYQKNKIYQVRLHKPLTLHDKKTINDGVMLEDGVSRLQLKGDGSLWTITMQEGRNRQIRRTFTALGYSVRKLHRTQFGPYNLGQLAFAEYSILC